MTAKFIGSGHLNENSKYYTVPQADSLLSAKSGTSHTHSGYQPSNTNLTAIAGLTSAANKLPYFTGSGTSDVTDISSLARTLLGNTSSSNMRSTLGLVIDTNVQAYDADLAAIAAIAATTGFLKKTAANTWSLDTAVLTSASTLDSTKLSGTIPADVLGASSLFLGTTSVALNRASNSGHTLSGVNITGNAATVTNGVYTSASNTFIPPLASSASPIIVRGGSTSFSISSIVLTGSPSVYLITTSGVHNLAGTEQVVVGAYSGSINSVPSTSTFTVYAPSGAPTGTTGVGYNDTVAITTWKDYSGTTTAFATGAGRLSAVSVDASLNVDTPLVSFDNELKLSSLNSNIAFDIGGTVKARITSSYFLASSGQDTSPNTSSTPDTTDSSGALINTGTGALSQYYADSTSTTYLYGLFSNVGGTRNRKVAFTANGDGYFDGGADLAAADYAEYFEWEDGNPDNEDRVGKSVVLVTGSIIRFANAQDPAADIIGIVSAKPAIVGDSAWNEWAGKYVKDAFGRKVNVNPNPGQVTWEVVPGFDESEVYIPRADRPEWSPIGLLGKLRVFKDEPKGSRWIKLRDINSDVEEWLVR